jgi:hypothetical protein
MRFDIPAIKLSFETGEAVSLTGIDGFIKGQKDGYFWAGEQQVNVAKLLSLSSEEYVSASTSNMSYYSNTLDEQSVDSLKSNIVIKANDVVIEQEKVLDSMNVDLIIGGINKQFAEKLLTMAQDDVELSQPEFIRAAEDLVAQGMYLSLNQAKFEIDDGVFESNFRLELLAGLENFTENAMQVLPALTGNIEATITNPLLDSVPVMQQAVDELVVMELAETVDNGYRVAATISDGNMVFDSGEEIPLIALFMFL